jgi:hypothetical protein
MKVELYTKNLKGKCEVVGEIHTPGYPVVGATITSVDNTEYEIVSYAMEYDRHGNFEGCSAEVKISENEN